MSYIQGYSNTNFIQPQQADRNRSHSFSSSNDFSRSSKSSFGGLDLSALFRLLSGMSGSLHGNGGRTGGGHGHGGFPSNRGGGSGSGGGGRVGGGHDHNQHNHYNYGYDNYQFSGGGGSGS